MTSLSIPLAASLGAGFAGTFVARMIAKRMSVVSQPNPIVPGHFEPVAYLGGVGVLAGFTAGAFLAKAGNIEIPPILLPAAMFTFLGLADDVWPFQPLPKFLCQIAIALMGVSSGLSAVWMEPGLANAVVTVATMVTLVNAANFIDVCDGLLAGCMAASTFAIALFAPSLNFVAAIIGFAFLGFLPLNLPRASIFLGDAGSHLAGSLLAALALRMPAGDAATAVCRLVLIAALPLFELVFITSIRIGKGLPWWKGSPDHFALRLQALGWSRWAIVAVAALLTVFFNWSGFAVPGAGLGAAMAFYLGCGLLASWFLLSRSYGRF